MLSQEQKLLLTETAHRYAEQLDRQTASYLLGRGITKEAAGTFHLGTVSDPAPGHEHAVGCLSIPYRTPTGVVGIKFRKVDGGSPKYLWPTGQKIGMFNVVDLHDSSDDDDLGGFVGKLIVGLELLGNGGTEFRDAGRRRVYGEARIEGSHGGGFNEFRSVKIRFARAEADHIEAFGLHGFGTGIDGQGGGRGEKTGAFCVIKSHGDDISFGWFLFCG